MTEVGELFAHRFILEGALWAEHPVCVIFDHNSAMLSDDMY